jgi:hypothetical protein
MFASPIFEAENYFKNVKPLITRMQNDYDVFIKNMINIIGTCWYIPANNNTWKILSFHKESNTFGQFYLIIENQTIKYSIFKSIIFGKRHPLAKVYLIDFIDKINQKEIIQAYMYNINFS